VKEVYLIHNVKEDIFKVGVSKNSLKRVKQLQTGSGNQIVLKGFYRTEIAYKIESTIHNLWSYKKYIGDDFTNLEGEWFVLSIEDIISFKDFCKKIEDNFNKLKQMSNPFI
jgi:hypothetical protein